MIHDAPIVRMNALYLPKKIRRWMGEFGGPLEGDTLVVDTTNFTDNTRFSSSMEYLRASSASTASRRRTGEYTWPATDKPIYEYA